MRFFPAVYVALALLLNGVVASASPLKGQMAYSYKVPGGRTLQLKYVFKGGERACVIVIGDHDPVVRLRVKVEDAKGQVVAEDDYGGDFCAAIWFPPRDGEYLISISVPHIGGEQDWNKLYIAVK
jgi:hypothetical protein